MLRGIAGLDNLFHDLWEHVQTILVYGEISVLFRLGKYEVSCLDTVEN